MAKGDTVLSNRLPLYMQHSGHSRVVVGISLRGKGKGKGQGQGTGAEEELQLIVLDPATYGVGMKRSLKDNKPGWHAMVKCGLGKLKKSSYEFLVVGACDKTTANGHKDPNFNSEVVVCG